jgi:hypothetical protein
MKKAKAVLKINEYTTLNNGVSSDEGDKINDIINQLLKEYEVVELDFSDIKLLTTAFLNAAIGQLYKDYTSEKLSARLKLTNVTPDDAFRFKLVTNRAKEYFKNKQSFDESVNKIVNEERNQ